VFCPNCGTQNESAATPCKKCGFKLSSISVPKFKGTMMLNSDQTVQDMIEEHRRKQGEFAERTRRASEPPPSRTPSNPPPPARTPSNPPPPARPPSNPPPSSGASPRAAVLQPPRVGVGKRRMGGTMMGVAPQAGGITPRGPSPRESTPEPPRSPDPGFAAVAPLAHRDPGAASPEPPPSASLSDNGPADVLAGTVEVPVSDPPPPPPPARPRSTPLPGHTRPFERPLSPPEEKAGTPAPPETAPARRALAKTAPLPQVPEATTESDFEAASRTIPPKLSALDIILIVCTCGVYALFLRSKQRKPPTA